MKLRLHAYEAASRANGPGLRAVVWFQGCSIRCPGCFNPETHDPGGGHDADTEEVARWIMSKHDGIEGLSVSGGEPFEQPEALMDLVKRVRASALSILVFSGYSLEQIRKQPLGTAILHFVDVLVAGPYQQSDHWGKGLLGSTNQEIHLLTERYNPAAFADLPFSEVILHADGSVTVSGVSPLSL